MTGDEAIGVGEEVFDEDYLYFYAERLGPESSDQETELVARLLSLEPGMDVLDAPCGHGRIVCRLAARGCRVVGLDASAAFLELARSEAAEAGVNVEYVQGDLRDLPFGERFDGALNWFTSFGYFDDEGNRRVLAEFHRVLRPGGALLIDLLQRDALLRSLPAGGQPGVMVEERGDDLMIDRVQFDVQTGRLNTDRMILREGHRRRLRFSVRLPTLQELSAWLEETGFSSVQAFGPGGEPLTLESRRLLVVAERGSG